MTMTVDNLQRCEFCRFVGEMDYQHGKFKCPQCKQIPAFGDCCQGDSCDAALDPIEDKDVNR